MDIKTNIDNTLKTGETDLESSTEVVPSNGVLNVNINRLPKDLRSMVEEGYIIGIRETHNCKITKGLWGKDVLIDEWLEEEGLIKGSEVEIRVWGDEL